MMASIIVEAWDLYSIAFVLIFIRDTFHPTPALLGLAAAGTQGGAVRRGGTRRPAGHNGSKANSISVSMGVPMRSPEETGPLRGVRGSDAEGQNGRQLLR